MGIFRPQAHHAARIPSGLALENSCSVAVGFARCRDEQDLSFELMPAVSDYEHAQLGLVVVQRSIHNTHADRKNSRTGSAAHRDSFTRRVKLQGR